VSAAGPSAAAGEPGSRTRPYEDVSELVSQFLERATLDGSAALEQLCDGHPLQAGELRRRVRRLQELGLAGGAGPGQLQSIGPFRVLGVLGEGGMGRVYLGQQTAPVRRLVAIKLMHPAREAARLLQRFEAERQALALLHHPGIAQVLEAGALPDGSPWFAMEFVEGQSITVACDAARLPLRERMELFLQLCDAMTHAHQNGILHRDLKPNNALVTDGSGRRLVKVIDFGLAKVIDPSQGATDLTLDGQVLGTPSYMSPEQAGVLDRPVDLRTDVYSLGVMLHELLVGRRPLHPAPGAAGMHEMLRLLRDVEPLPPSRAVAGLPPELAAARGLDPRRWARALSGDLDWIVGKALAKEPSQRYASVSELAGDLRRHLRDEPVLAGPPSAIYRLDRFVRRHRREVAVGALGVLGLLVALVYISVQALRLSRELDSFDVLARELEVASLYRTAEAELWPEVPERLHDIAAWQHSVRAVEADVPTFRALLDGIRFENPRDGYLHDHIVGLLASIEALTAPGGPVEQVAQREAWARGLHALTIDEPAPPAVPWPEAIAGIADRSQCPAYDGLVIEPQLGLLPLGRNPGTGLWEFAFPRPGEALPERVEGRWRVADDTCMVFVLVPGGSFQQGAEGFSAQEAGGKRVTLDPYFLSCFEMTQGQWERFTGSNPSRYKLPNGLVTGRMHPVEQVTWIDGERTLSRLGLALPTGAQWEYAALAGAASPWWTGPAEQPSPEWGNFADRNLLDDKGRMAGLTDFHADVDDGWTAHAPVDSYLPNPFGLYNVMGNLWEWCRDHSYRHAKTTPREGDGLQIPLEPDPGYHSRELRGGSFYSTYPGSRSTFYLQQSENSVNHVFGLRPARALVSG
jgi:serine/threonine protein kinase/formylglycine-generating enzyme required for sulfatase activity